MAESGYRQDRRPSSLRMDTGYLQIIVVAGGCDQMLTGMDGFSSIGTPVLLLTLYWYVVVEHVIITTPSPLFPEARMHSLVYSLLNYSKVRVYFSAYCYCLYTSRS